MANGVGASGNVVQPTPFDTLEKARKFAETKNQGEEVIIQEDGKWVVYDMDDASQVAAVKEKVAKLDVAQVEFVGDYDAKTYGPGNAKLKSANYEEAAAMAKLMGMEPPTKQAGESEKDFMKRVQREANRQLLLASPPGSKPNLIKVDGDIRQESHAAVREVIVGRADALAARQKAYGEAYQALNADIEAYNKMPATKPEEIKAKQDKYAELKGKKEKLEKDFPGLKADAAAAKESQLHVAASQIKQSDYSGIAAEPNDPAKLELKEAPKEAPKEEPKKPAEPTFDKTLEGKAMYYIAEARKSNDDDDLGQRFVRCLTTAPHQWSAEDKKWMVDHGFADVVNKGGKLVTVSKLDKLGPEALAEVYRGMATGWVTGGEHADMGKLLGYARDKGMLGPMLNALTKDKVVLDAVMNEAKKANLATWALTAEKPATGSTNYAAILEHGDMGKGELNEVYKRVKDDPKLVRDPAAYDALMEALKAKKVDDWEAKCALLRERKAALEKKA